MLAVSKCDLNLVEVFFYKSSAAMCVIRSQDCLDNSYKNTSIQPTFPTFFFRGFSFAWYVLLFNPLYMALLYRCSIFNIETMPGVTHVRSMVGILKTFFEKGENFEIKPFEKIGSLILIEEV